MVRVNGESVSDAVGKTVSAYLEHAGYTPEHIAVELNLEILPKGKYSETVISDGDSIEIVHFMGGG